MVRRRVAPASSRPAPAPRRRRSHAAAPRSSLDARAIGLHQLVERRRCLVEHRDLLARKQLQRTRRASGWSRRAPPPAGRRAAAAPSSSQTEKSKANEWNSVQHRPAPKPNQCSVAAEQAHHVAVRDHHALGPAGRAGGVDDVGQCRAAGAVDRRGSRTRPGALGLRPSRVETSTTCASRPRQPVAQRGLRDHDGRRRRPRA